MGVLTPPVYVVPDDSSSPTTIQWKLQRTKGLRTMELRLSEEELARIVAQVKIEILDELDFAQMIHDEVREALDYHGDVFNLSWMRMMEREAHDLETSTLHGACDHGQKMYRAFFKVIDEYIKEKKGQNTSDSEFVALFNGDDEEAAKELAEARALRARSHREAMIQVQRAAEGAAPATVEDNIGWVPAGLIHDEREG